MLHTIGTMIALYMFWKMFFDEPAEARAQAEALALAQTDALVDLNERIADLTFEIRCAKDDQS